MKNIFHANKYKGKLICCVIDCRKKLPHCYISLISTLFYSRLLLHFYSEFVNVFSLKLVLIGKPLIKYIEI